MWGLMSRHKEKSAACALLIVIESAINIYAGYQLSSFYNIITAQDIGKAISYGLYLVLIWIAAVTFQYLASGYEAYLIKVFHVDLQDEILQKLSNLGNEEFARRESGEYASWLVNDVQTIETNAIRPFFLILHGASMAIFGVIALVSLHWVLLVGALISALALSLIPKLFHTKLQVLTQELSADNERFSQTTYNLLSGFEVFYFANKIPRMMSMIQKAYRSAEQKKFRIAVRTAVMNMTMNSIYRIFEITLQILAAVIAFLKIVNFGSVFAISNLSNRFLRGIDDCFVNLALLRSTTGIFEKWKDDPEKPAVQPALTGDVLPCPPIEHGIRVHQLVVHYGEKPVLKGQDYEFEIGKKYAIVGESGCGKTTLVRTILGLQNQYDGQVLFDGVERRRYDVRSVIAQFGYIDQNTFLFTDTIRFNLTLGDSVEDSLLYEILEKVNLLELIRNSPMGLDTVISNQQNNISGGQRQRLGIARALLQKKRILVVDEGTSALDSRNAAIIEDLLLDDKNGLTVLAITHHLKDSSRFSRIYHL